MGRRVLQVKPKPKTPREVATVIVDDYFGDHFWQVCACHDHARRMRDRIAAAIRRERKRGGRG